MCGIAGSINWHSKRVLADMIALQHHRGPDDGGIWYGTGAQGEDIGLAARRLSIRDLSHAGHMPMHNANGNLTIVYNGEIYNTPTLRRLLQDDGVVFRSDCDTEVVLYLYERYGPGCVEKLNGMFAIAIWDQREQQLFIARDHFGIKPLYYTRHGERFAFASEAKSLLCLPDFQARMDFESLHQYLSFLWVPEPRTLFEGIHKLPAAHYAVIRDGQMQLTRYWDIDFPPAPMHPRHDDVALAEELRNRFDEVIRLQLQSDVPVGAFLSAGLDSSCILSAMHKQLGESIHTYTITFPERYRMGETAMDDPTVAARTAAHFGAKHREIRVEPNVAELLPRLIWHMDEPVADPALLTAYLVNRAAREDVTVLLSGVGGDELFAGYRKHQAQRLAQHYRRLPDKLRHGVVEPLVKALPGFRGTPLKGHVRLLKKLTRSASLPAAEQFITDSIYLSETEKHDLYSNEMLNRASTYLPETQHLIAFERVASADFLNQMLYLDSTIFMPSLNLNYNDKMSMACSVEVRVPFLDVPFSEWVAREVAPSQKLRGNTTKHILRCAMQTRLPKEVMKQKKAGFSAPVDYWLANELQDMSAELLAEKVLRERGLFNSETVKRMLKEQSSGRRDWSMQIWQLLTLELWQREFIDS